MSQLLDDLEKLISPVLEAESVDLVDLTYQKSQGAWVLCLFIDKSNGVTLDDCTEWGHRIGDILDQKDLIPHAYSLEISSPGLNRPLKKLRDFQKFMGERVEVKLYAPMDGQKHFQGILKAVNENDVAVQLHQDNREVVILRSQIAKANLDPMIDV